jgi:hypothetical protein
MTTALTNPATEIDQKPLFTALGFLAVALRGDAPADQAERALAVAGLIDSFCRLHVPEAFEDEIETADVATRDRMASVIRDIIRADGRCSQRELCEHGFSDSEIRRYWSMALALACVSLNIRREVS